MKFIPKSVTRLSGRSLLKLSKHSPTILVVGGVVGLAATAVLAARATRHLDPIIEHHKAQRNLVVEADLPGRDAQKALLGVYIKTGMKLTKLYGPTLFIGASSAVSVLGGHKILRGRQIATLAAYSGLLEQFNSYRGRVSRTLGPDVEAGIFEGATGEWIPGEKKGQEVLVPNFDQDDSSASYLRPWYDESNPNWTVHPAHNYAFLSGVQQHMNHLLSYRGHVFLNDVYDALGMVRTREGSVSGWVNNGKSKRDGYVDFGFMQSIDPHTVAFTNGAEPSVRLNFNIDGSIWDQI